MIRVAVLCPVLGRPDRAAPLVESLAASVSGPVLEAFVVFLCSPEDGPQRAACHAVESALTIVVDWEAGPGDYAMKMNYGLAQVMESEWVVGPRGRYYREALPDFFLLGADDLVFHPGWLEAALIVQLETGACVIGTNDRGNRSVIAGTHATHPLVHVSYGDYGTIDEPGQRLLHEGYDHCFVDNEFVGTAKARGTFAPATESVVEHMHPIWRKGSDDATYRKGQRAFAADRALHDRRKKLWTP